MLVLGTLVYNEYTCILCITVISEAFKIPLIDKEKSSISNNKKKKTVSCKKAEWDMGKSF